MKGKLKHIILNKMGLFVIPLIYKIVFKNASPLGFMIEKYYQKMGCIPVEIGFIGQKNEMHWEKNEVYL